MLLDAGNTDLCERFAPGSLAAVLVTHFHMDHVMGLFHLRWGVGLSIPVYAPADPQGCDDLYRHPGILDFRPLQPFVPLVIGPFSVTPLPLIHSRLCHGFLIAAVDRSLAYLTDTVGLPMDTLDYLQRQRPDLVVLDCSKPPSSASPGNHNDLNQALYLAARIGAPLTLLTHIGHDLDAYWLDRPELPAGVSIARDGLCITL